MRDNVLRLPSRSSRETLRTMSPTSIWFWIAFNAGVFLALTLDLVQFKHRGRELSMRAAAHRTLIWIGLSLLFNLVVWKIRGPEKGLEFLTGYVIEYSLSVDNIFIFVVIFQYFKVPGMAQHRALVWGIVGALVMRGIMIWVGIELVQRFEFILYIFGGFLLISAWRMFFVEREPQDFGQSWIMRVCQRAVFPVTPTFYGVHFKRLRHRRLALALFSARQDDRTVHLPEKRSRCGPRVRRTENDFARPSGDPGSHLACGDCFDPDDHNSDFVAGHAKA